MSTVFSKDNYFSSMTVSKPNKKIYSKIIVKMGLMAGARLNPPFQLGQTEDKCSSLGEHLLQRDLMIVVLSERVTNRTAAHFPQNTPVILQKYGFEY